MTATVEDRLRAIEDQLAIYQIISGYGYSADGCNSEAMGALYAEDGVYAVADMPPFEGRAAIQSITTLPYHLQLVTGGCGHLSTLPHVVIDGDRASATCHTMVVQKSGDGYVVGRLSASRIELSRKPEGGWQIDHRQNYLLDGDPAGPALLGRFREGPSPRSRR